MGHGPLWNITESKIDDIDDDLLALAIMFSAKESTKSSSHCLSAVAIRPAIKRISEGRRCIS